MTAADLALLDHLPGLAFAFGLVLARVGAAVMLMPGFAETEIPAVVRAGLALAVTILLLPAIAPLVPAGGGPWNDLAMVAAELLAGGMLGWLARLVALSLPVAGQIMSVMLGLTSVLQTDPALGAQSSALSRMFNLVAPVAILASGLYALPLAALAASYRIIPPGTLLGAGDSAAAAAAAAASCFAVAMRLAAPFVLASAVWQVSLGIVSRLVPHMQVYFAALPAQILGGLLLLGLLGGPVVMAWLDATGAGFAALPGR